MPFVAALQALAPLPRAALVLCDVLGWTPVAAAAALDRAVGAIEQALAEGRAGLARRYVPALGRREPPPDERLPVLLMQYLHPWETADDEGLLARLAPDVVWQLPPSPTWYQGREAVRRYLAAGPFGGDARGRWRLLPRRANGQLAFGVYERDDARDVYRAHSLQVVTFAGELVAEIVAFAAPALFPSFQLLPEIVVQGRSPGGSGEC